MKFKLCCNLKKVKVWSNVCSTAKLCTKSTMQAPTLTHLWKIWAGRALLFQTFKTVFFSQFVPKGKKSLKAQLFQFWFTFLLVHNLSVTFSNFQYMSSNECCCLETEICTLYSPRWRAWGNGIELRVYSLEAKW